MGWCSGSSVFLAATEFFEGEADSWKAFAETLQQQDWDCEDDALDGLVIGSPPYRGLLMAMGKNPDCPGRCMAVNCEGVDYCGCVCHY